MKLYLIRHAQSVANAEGKQMPDPALTNLGHIQAEVTSRWLKTHTYRASIHDVSGEALKPTVIYSSPARRGLQTSVYLSKVFNMPINVDKSLHEVGGAHACDATWGGLPRSDVLKILPDACFDAGYSVFGWWFQDVEEDIKEALMRAKKWLLWLQTRHNKEDVVLVVGHGALFDCVAAVAFGHPDQLVWMSMHNAAIARLDWEDGVCKMVFWNQHEHLQEILSY